MQLPGFRAELPHGLAALRIALAVVVLISPELWQAPEFAAAPALLRFAPEGLGWLSRHVPISVPFAHVAQAVLLASCAAAIVGIAARTAMFAMTVSGLYVFGLSQLSGAVIHDMHIFWLSALLCVSPCGDALSMMRPAPAPPTAAIAYGMPLQFARLLLAVVYFFPGFWKLRTSGWAWIASDNLRNQLYWKWYELAREPPMLRFDRSPELLHTAAFLVVLFELGFVVLIWFRRGRLIAAAAGIAFHLGTQWLMGVTFVSLMACYVVLLPWERLTVPPVAAGEAAPIDRRSLPALCLGGVLLIVCSIQGARAATQAWPFGCFPTFDRVLGDKIADLRIEAVFEDGETVVVPDGPSSGGARRSSQGWARAWQVAGFYGKKPDPELLRAYWDDLRVLPLAAAATEGATVLRFYAVTYSVLPERRSEQPLEQVWLGELTL